MKTLWACLRSSRRSQRKRMRLAHRARSRSSQSETATRVLPVPVAWTIRHLRCLAANRSTTRLIASIWYIRPAIFGVGPGLDQRLPVGPLEVEVLEAVLRVEAVELAGRLVLGVVPDPEVVAVGVEDHGTLAVRLLEAVGVALAPGSGPPRHRPRSSWPRSRRAACRCRPRGRNRPCPCRSWSAGGRPRPPGPPPRCRRRPPTSQPAATSRLSMSLLRVSASLRSAMVAAFIPSRRKSSLRGRGWGGLGARGRELGEELLEERFLGRELLQGLLLGLPERLFRLPGEAPQGGM